MLYSYSYQKATFENPHPGKKIPPYLKLIPTLASAVGLGLISSVIWPIINYQTSFIIRGKQDYPLSGFISPLVLEDSSSVVAQENSGPQIISDVDFSKASNWFTNSSLLINTYKNPNQSGPQSPRPSSSSTVDFFKLSIPNLGIKNALVKINGEDLNKSLIHYPETALPGNLGSVIIFGHSTLPQFFKPDDYSSIFSTLPTIEVGSDIFINYDQVTYTYRVVKTYEVKPEDTWILRQDYDQKSLKLVTCVPPGTRLRRLIVEAKLIINQ